MIQSSFLINVCILISIGLLDFIWMDDVHRDENKLMHDIVDQVESIFSWARAL